MEMLKLCMEYEAPIVMGSDAHVDTDVGRHDEALQLLEEMNFPERPPSSQSVRIPDHTHHFHNSANGLPG